jgi:hypothetical protein
VRTEAPRIHGIAAQICTAFPANATQCSQDTEFVSAYDFGRRRSAVVAGNFNARAERAVRLRVPCLRLCVSSVHSSLLFTLCEESGVVERNGECMCAAPPSSYFLTFYLHRSPL